MKRSMIILNVPMPGTRCFMGKSVHRCLEALTPEHREVLLLRFLEEMSYDQIADVSGCPIGTVKSRIYHAKCLLRQEMETHFAKE